MGLKASNRLGLSNLQRASNNVYVRMLLQQAHLSDGIHCSPDADLRLDGLKVLVEQHTHAGLHCNCEPEQEVVVLAEQRILEVNGCVGDDKETGQCCGKTN
jgi:hypothetical protein